VPLIYFRTEGEITTHPKLLLGVCKRLAPLRNDGGYLAKKFAFALEGDQVALELERYATLLHGSDGGRPRPPFEERFFALVRIARHKAAVGGKFGDEVPHGRAPPPP
jgi:hypothetical protein